MCLGGQEHLNDPAQRLGMSVSRHPVTVWTKWDCSSVVRSLGYQSWLPGRSACAGFQSWRSNEAIRTLHGYW